MEFHNLPNTQKRVSSWVIWALVAIIAGIPFAEPPVAATGKRFKHLRIHSFSRRITWTPPAVTTTIAPGESQTLSVSLTAARTLRNVRVRVARELQPFVHVGPAAFERIGKGQTVNINLTIFAPSSMAAGRIEGKFRLFRQLGFGRKGKTIMIPLLLARPLPVVIDIEPTAPVITITNPEEDATVAAESLLVSGTVDAGGEEVGVTVNDFPAAVQWNTFAALVPVTPETTTLTVIATTPSGATANHSITVASSAPLTPTIALRSSPSSGVAPLTVAFSLAGGPVPTTINLDLVGDGTVDFGGPSLEGQTFTYPEPGLFFPTVTLTDADGNQHTASAVVQVYDQPTLDSLLQAKWTGMKDALQQEDTPAALQFIASRNRDVYKELFAELAPELPKVGANLGDIRIIRIRVDLAEYELLVVEDGQTISYYVEFIKDTDGLWRVNSF
jgi:hypothetical protein